MIFFLLILNHVENEESCCSRLHMKKKKKRKEKRKILSTLWKQFYRNNNSIPFACREDSIIRWSVFIFPRKFSSKYVSIRAASDWSRHYHRREAFSSPGLIIFPIDKEGCGAIIIIVRAARVQKESERLLRSPPPPPPLLLSILLSRISILGRASNRTRGEPRGQLAIFIDYTAG